MSAISPNQLNGPHLLPEGHPRWSQAKLAHDDTVAIDFDPSSQRTPFGDLGQVRETLKRGLASRWRRERRRRKIGRAYDMALEIARVIPRGSRVLDVGCGNGFIAHHLNPMLGTQVTGIDLAETTEALINYRQFDGSSFPVQDRSVDAILFCYVLHHAQDLRVILGEARRTLSDGGRVVVYEDIPGSGWDKIICEIHNRKWQGKTGPCIFRGEREWCDTFASEGFELCQPRRLSRWRNLAHPVSRKLFVLRLGH